MIYTDYEQNAFREIESWKCKEPSRMRKIEGYLLDRTPRAITDLIERPEVQAAVQKVTETLLDVGTWSVDSAKVLEEYRLNGLDITKIEMTWRDVPLEIADLSARRSNLLHVGGAAGLGAAGGAGVVLSTMASQPIGAIAAALGETLATIALCCRQVAATGIRYGFDSADPRERLFALSVLETSLAPNISTKLRALNELKAFGASLIDTEVTLGSLASESAIGKLLVEAAEKLGYKITIEQVVRFATVIGAVAGGAVNASFAYDIQQTSYHLYRERYLKKKEAMRVNGTRVSKAGDYGVVPPDPDEAMSPKTDPSTERAMQVLSEFGRRAYG